MSVRASLGALRERDFRLLWTGASLSAVGDAFVPVATAFAVLELGTASDLGLVLGAAIAGRMAFMLVGGVWADRLPRRSLMIGADLVRASVQGAIAVAFLTDRIEIWHLVAASVVFGIASAFFQPASSALLPQLVSPARIQEANALLSLSRQGAELLGPALAGGLVALVGYGAVYAIDAASFAASLLCLLAIRPVAAAVRERQSFLAEARDGIREVLARPWMRVTLVADAFGNFAIAPYFVLGPLVVDRHLDGAADWGLVLAAGAAGGIAGGALVLRWRPERPLVPGYALLLAIPLALLTLVRPLPLPALMLGSALFFGSIVVSNTFWSTMEQQHVPNEALARVDSVAWMIALVIMPVAYVVTGPVAEWLGVREALLAAAAIGTASTTYVLLSRSVRELRRLDDEVAQPHELEPVVPALSPGREAG